MAEPRKRPSPGTATEDHLILEHLNNALKDSSSTIALFDTFVTHLALAVDLLKQWERLSHRVDYLERREHDLTQEIQRLEARKQRMETEIYAR